MKRKFVSGLFGGLIGLFMVLMVLGAVDSVNARGVNVARSAVPRDNAVAAATIAVTTLTDELTNNGLCSLREAISAANRDTAIGGCTAGSGLDTIVLPPGVYQVKITGTSELDNLDGAIDISTSLTISGSGLALTIIEGGPTFNEGLFHIHGTASVKILGVMLRNGHGPGVWNGASSSLLISGSAIVNNNSVFGGLLSQGSMTLTNSSVYSNSQGGISGGGDLILIHSSVLSNTSTGGVAGIDGGSGHVTLINSTIGNNVAGSGIGGVYANGPLLIVGSQIARNRSTGQPGGIAGASADVIISNSQIMSNVGTVGGISSFGNMTIANSLIANNVAITNYGGGLLNIVGNMLIQNSTILSNAAPNGGGLANGYGVVVMTGSQVLSNTATRGGGIGNAGVITVSNSTVAGNVASGIGGGFANDSGLVVGVGNAVIQNSSVHDNVAALGGGVANGGALTLTNSTLSNNHATVRGGGLTIGNGSTYISGTQLLTNVAPLGAGLYQTYDTQYGANRSRSKLIGVLIQGNTVGGLVIASGTLTISRSTLNTNSPNCNVIGGALVSLGNNTSGDGSCSLWFTQPGDSNGVSYLIYLPLVLKNS
jgi:CSLREA domain-containing protein